MRLSRLIEVLGNIKQRVGDKDVVVSDCSQIRPVSYEIENFACTLRGDRKNDDECEENVLHVALIISRKEI